MKPEKLSPKALTLMVNMHGMTGPVTSADLAFLAPAPSGSRDWALSALKRLADMDLLSEEEKVGTAQSFALTEAGRQAMLAQAPALPFDPSDDETLYYYDGPVLSLADIHGATRLVMAEAPEEGRYVMGSPSAQVIEDLLNNRVTVGEAMAVEPCLRMELDEDGNGAIGADPIDADWMRAYCGKSAYLVLETDARRRTPQNPDPAA